MAYSGYIFSAVGISIASMAVYLCSAYLRERRVYSRLQRQRGDV